VQSAGSETPPGAVATLWTASGVSSSSGGSGHLPPGTGSPTQSRDGTVIAEVADATVHDAQKAVRAATEAQASWALTPVRARPEILHRLPVDGRADRGAGAGDDPEIPCQVM
jgi:acyl-CoA reductase-like NAD-dependent aldehyde dehydrogenase